MNYLINIPYLKNTIKSLKKKNIMFIDQVVTVDSLYLLSWKEIQASTGQKVGRPPKWYFYLRDNFTHYLNHDKSLRLIHEIKAPIMSSNFVYRIPTPNKNPHPYKHKNLWVAFWDNTVKEIQYGKLIETYNLDNESAKTFMVHYKVLPNDTDVHKTPRSRPRQLIPCNGKLDNCTHTRPFYGSCSMAHSCFILKELSQVLKVKISKY